nr:peroxidase 25 [Tanacetum cinerariifolium]
MAINFLIVISPSLTRISVAKSQAGLTSGFYSSICPKAEATARSAVETHFKDDHTVVATLLRLHFHDCFVESICLECSCREYVVHRLLSLMIKHYVGEDPEPLSLREFQNVEQQLETALKQIRIRKDGMLKNKSTYEIMSPEDIGLTLGKLRYANYIMQKLYGASGYFKEEAESKYSKILALRGLSFSTISSVGPNRAIIHYQPEAKTYAELSHP